MAKIKMPPQRQANAPTSSHTSGRSPRSIVYTVPQSHCVIIERFGKYARTQTAGINFRIPFLEKIKAVPPSWRQIAHKNGWQIELTEQITDTPPRECFTKDNVKVTVDATVYWRIVDARKAVYEIDELINVIEDIPLNALRSNIGNLELDQVLSDRQALNEKIAAQLSDSATKWGIQFTRVEIQELKADKDVEKAMRQQLEGERQKRETVSLAEGAAAAQLKDAEAQRDAQIMVAEGKAQAVKLEAEAKARALEMDGEARANALEKVKVAEYNYLYSMSQVLPAEKAAELLIAQRYIDGFSAISAKDGDKVFLPNNFQGLFNYWVDSDRGGPSKPGIASD